MSFVQQCWWQPPSQLWAQLLVCMRAGGKTSAGAAGVTAARDSSPMGWGPQEQPQVGATQNRVHALPGAMQLRQQACCVGGHCMGSMQDVLVLQHIMKAHC